MHFQSVSLLQSPTNCITITCQLDEITWINARYHMLIEMRTRERLQVITCFEYGGIVMKNKCRLQMSMIKRVLEQLCAFFYFDCTTEQHYVSFFLQPFLWSVETAMLFRYTYPAKMHFTQQKCYFILFYFQLLIYWPFYIYTFTNIGQARIQITATFALANLEKFCQLNIGETL